MTHDEYIKRRNEVLTEFSIYELNSVGRDRLTKAIDELVLAVIGSSPVPSVNNPREQLKYEQRYIVKGGK